MCRNIRTLFHVEPPATEQKVRAAALQFVRTLVGYNVASSSNEAAFEHAVDGVSAAPARDREEESARAQARSVQRLGSG